MVVSFAQVIDLCRFKASRTQSDNLLVVCMAGMVMSGGRGPERGTLSLAGDVLVRHVTDKQTRRVSSSRLHPKSL